LKNSQIERLIPHHPVVQLLKHLVQNWPLGFAEDAVPESAVTLKVILRVAGASHLLGQVMSVVQVDRGEMSVRRFEGQRD
jgi:hypothetical protein